MPTYFPAAQSVHVATFDAVEYFPTTHVVHNVAPGPVPVSVIEPRPHEVQDSTFDAVEYVPAAHAVHVVAPAAEPVSVIEPAWQSARVFRRVATQPPLLKRIHVPVNTR